MRSARSSLPVSRHRPASASLVALPSAPASSPGRNRTMAGRGQLGKAQLPFPAGPGPAPCAVGWAGSRAGTASSSWRRSGSGSRQPRWGRPAQPPYSPKGPCAGPGAISRPAGCGRRSWQPRAAHEDAATAGAVHGGSHLLLAAHRECADHLTVRRIDRIKGGFGPGRVQCRHGRCHVAHRACLHGETFHRNSSSPLCRSRRSSCPGGPGGLAQANASEA